MNWQATTTTKNNAKNENRNTKHFTKWLRQTYGLINEFHWPSRQAKLNVMLFSVVFFFLSFCCCSIACAEHRCRYMLNYLWKIIIIGVAFGTLEFCIQLNDRWAQFCYTELFQVNRLIRVRTSEKPEKRKTTAATTTKCRTIPFMNDWMRDDGPCAIA